MVTSLRFKTWVVVACCCFLGGAILGYEIPAARSHASFDLQMTNPHHDGTYGAPLIDRGADNGIAWAATREPAWMVLLGTVLIGIGWWARRRRKSLR